MVALPAENRESASLGIWITTGGRYENKEFKGISHYLEHMLFKGSKKYSCRKIKESIEGVGGSLNGFTSEELTCYLVKIPAQHLEMSLDVLSDMVINPLLAEEEVEKERTVILEEAKMYKDLPQSYVYELLDELLWPDQPLGSSIIGTEESISRIKKDDLGSYQKKYYTPRNIVISACGKLNYQLLVKRVERLFGKLSCEAVNAFSRAEVNQSKPQLKLLDKDTEQTHMVLGFHGFRRDHELRHALGLLHIILGANMSSRLFNELREKRGLAYEIGTQVKRFHDTGAFIVHAGIDNKKVGDAIGVILEELSKVTKEQVSAGEFRRAKDFYMGQLSLALEDTLDHMLWIGESTACMNKTYTLKDIIKEVAEVSRQDVLKAAKGVLNANNTNLALIGPLKESESQIYDRLNIG